MSERYIVKEIADAMCDQISYIERLKAEIQYRNQDPDWILKALGGES